MKRLVVISIALAALSILWRDSAAEKLVVDLLESHLTTRTELSGEMGAYYLVSVPVPGAVSRQHIYGAYLEFFVDVSVTGAADGIDPAPRLQVCALTQSMGEEFDPSKLRAGRGTTNVPVGSLRKVRVDVTEMVRAWLATPASNHGVAIGALTGARDGRFTLRSNVRKPGVVAQLVVHY